MNGNRNASASAPIFEPMLVRELEDGQAVAQALLVREIEVRTKRDGCEFLKLVLSDRTGALAAVMWDAGERLASDLPRGSVAHVTGRYSVHERYGPQLTVQDLRPAEAGEYTLGDLLDGPARAPEQLEADMRDLIETVQDPHLRRLLDRLLGDESGVWAQYRAAPAAKYYHQAYRHGLLEHSLSVAQGVSAMSAIFGEGIDRDVAVTGALLHDIGKLEAYEWTGESIDLTDVGKLQGEIPLGYYRVRRAVEDLDGFPPGLAEAVLHIILSHHGALEHGSPVVPCTREATLVHMIDNLGGRLGSFDRLEKALPDGRKWSEFDRALGAGAFFAPREAA
jgi:3'-5' exoribonuclease